MAGPAPSITSRIVSLSRRPILGRLAFTVLVLLVGGSLIDAQPLLLDNPGFEQGSAGWLLKPGSETAEIAPDCRFSHSGHASLRLSGIAAESPYAAQLVERTQPLATYRLAAKVRSATGSTVMAAIRIEFYDASNRNISAWQRELRTSEDETWQTIEKTAIAEATAVNAVVVLRLLGSGQVWFDGVEFTVVSPAPALLPLPHDLVVTAGQADSVSFDLQLPEATAGSAQFKFFIDSPGLDRPLAADFRIDRANDRVFSMLLNVPKLEPGQYVLHIRRTDTGEVGQANLVAIPADCCAGAIRSDGVMLVDGEPFFPICAHWRDATDCEALEAAGFNTIELPSTDNLDKLSQLLDRAAQYHLKAIVPLYDSTDDSKSLADCAKKVERFRDHPALLAWKLIHLPTTHPDWRKPAIEAFLRFKQTSPDKPVLGGIGNPVQYQRWVDFIDWLEVICCPGSGGGLPTVAELTEQAQQAVHRGQMVHTTLPIPTGRDLPTQTALAQGRMMLYLALIAGAKGIGWRGSSSVTDEGELLRRINGEAAQIGRALVSGEIVHVMCSAKALRFRAVEHNGAIFIIVANTTDQRISARMQLPERATAAGLLYADQQPDAPYTPLQLSGNGRVVSFVLPGGQCDTVVATLAADDAESSSQVPGQIPL